MRGFRRDRIGQFIHWGLCSLPAGVWDGIERDFAAEFLPKTASGTWDDSVKGHRR